MSVYALTRGAAAILFSPAVGQYIDTGNRLQVVRLSIGKLPHSLTITLHSANYNLREVEIFLTIYVRSTRVFTRERTRALAISLLSPYSDVVLFLKPSISFTPTMRIKRLADCASLNCG
jgi:hypothetical protein